jgi:hypothetical protein
MAMIVRAKFSEIVAAALLAASLAGCTTSGTSDDKVGRLLVAPDKFVLYSCADIAGQAAATAARVRELEQLMAKAGEGSGGRLVSSIAYRPEYLERHGEMNELRSAAAAKNCKFVPGAENPGGRASNNAVR